MTIHDDMTYTFEGPNALVIVPNYVRDAINKRIDDAIVVEPGAAAEREQIYKTLVAYFSEYGAVPDFTLKRREGMPERN